ncbi:MAG: methylmalonyl-CoA epimerase [Candidatus Zixiibacteriota bacterium]
MRLNKIDHIGIAVKDIKEASKFYKDVFGCKISEETEVPDRKLRIAFTDISGVELEFLMATDKESTIAKFIDKRGEGIHHICFEVDDVDKAAEELEGESVELVDKPRIGAGGTKIVFLQPKSTHGVLIELKGKQSISGI